MKILLLTHSFNSLTQRVFVELRESGYDLSVELDINDETTMEAIQLFKPDLILGTYLKRKIPKEVWSNTPCLIVHPGKAGDRGPSSLDWAILKNENRGGVTLLKANDDYDAGEIWASCEFPLREGSKSSIYVNEVTDSAVELIKDSLEKWKKGELNTRSFSSLNNPPPFQPYMKQEIRKINWETDSTITILRKLNASDGQPGILDEIYGLPVYLYGGSLAHKSKITSKSKEVLAIREGAICLSTFDGAIWISHLKRKGKEQIKLPAAEVLKKHLPSIKPSALDIYPQEINYHEQGQVGYLSFDFQGGAMSTLQCKQLQQKVERVKKSAIKILVLTGGKDYWSNGIHLGVIESSSNPAKASLENIEAMNDLCLSLINLTDKMVIAAIQGNAGAGGVFLALTADKVLCQTNVILNPHYKSMGNLYGSEYWTYLLPKRVDAKNIKRIRNSQLPMGTREAKSIGLIDDLFGDKESFLSHLEKMIHEISSSSFLEEHIKKKQKVRLMDEEEKPLSSYRKEEIEKIKKNFFGFDPSYHIARHNFICKVPHARTPGFLAFHR